MREPDNKRLSGIDKIRIIQAVSIGSDELAQVLAEINGEQLIAARKLIMDLIIEYLGQNDNTKITSGELNKKTVPVAAYFSAQGCKETLEACKLDNCFRTNPVCFNRKVTGQIQKMLEYFAEKYRLIDEKVEP